MGLLTGTASAPQGHWEGNNFIFPRFDNRRPVPPPINPGLLAPIAQPTAPGQPMASGLLNMPSWADGGGGGEGRGDFNGTDATNNGANAANPGQAAVSQATMNAEPAPTGVVGPSAGVPGLPDFVDTHTPSEQNATATKGSVNDPDTDYAHSEDPDPAAASTGKSETTNTSPAAQAAAAAAAAGMVGAVDKSIADDQAATGLGIGTATGMTESVADHMGQTAPGVGNMSSGVNMNDVDETGGVTSNNAHNAMNGLAAATKGIASQVDAIASALGGIFGGLGAPAGSTGGLGGADGVGGPGAGGMGSPGGMGGGGSGAPGGSSDAGPGSWRTGGSSGGDGDGRLEPVPAILHEGEFVQKPEAVSYYGDSFMEAINERRIPKAAAMGLLSKARTEEGPKTIRRGLLGI